MDWISETITTTTGLDEISQFFVKVKKKKVKFNTQKAESKYTILSSRKTMKSRVNEQDTTLFSLGFDSRLGFARPIFIDPVIQTSSVRAKTNRWYKIERPPIDHPVDLGGRGETIFHCQ